MLPSEGYGTIEAMVRRACLAAGALALLASAGATAQPAPPAAASSDTAYFEFIRGRHLEGQGRLAEALESFERAAAAQPHSAQIRAEIAGLYARQSKTDEAIREAHKALALDPENVEANWVLGTIYATLLEARREDGRSGPGSSRAATGAAGPPGVAEAITHLERARKGRLYDSGLHMTLGRLYLAQQDWAKAIDVLFFIVDRDTGALDAQYLLAQAYDGAGDHERAIAQYQDVLAAEPRFYRALLDLADLLVRERRWEEASEAYARAVAEYPDNLDLKLRRAAALSNAGRRVEARDLLYEAAKVRPKEARIQFLLVDVERALRDYEAAERAARRVLELQPNQPVGAQALAQVFADRREYRDVIATLEPALAALEGQSDGARLPISMRLALGSAHLQLREFDKALAYFDRARKDGGADPTLDAYRTQAYLEAGRVEEAAAMAADARAAHPGDVRLVSLEAHARLKAGDAAKAIALFEPLARDRDDPAVPVAFAGLLLDAREFARAETVLRDAAAVFPAEVRVPFQLGAVYEEQAKYDEAEQAFRRALSIDPLHAPTLNYFGYMLADRGIRLDEAVTLLKKAVELDPYNGSYLDSLGWAYFKQGALPQAREYLLRAGDQLPANSVVQDHVGDLLYALQDQSGAIAAWERALAGDGRSIERHQIQLKIDKARTR